MEMSTSGAWMELQDLLSQVYDGTKADTETGSGVQPQQADPNEEPLAPAAVAASQTVPLSGERAMLTLAKLSTAELRDLADALVPQPSEGTRSSWAGHASVEEWRHLAELAEQPPAA